MKYMVRSAVYKADTGEPLRVRVKVPKGAKPIQLIRTSPDGSFREELIDTESNSLFKDCTSWRDVIRVFEGFWGPQNSTEIVRVIGVTKV